MLPFAVCWSFSQRSELTPVLLIQLFSNTIAVIYLFVPNHSAKNHAKALTACKALSTLGPSDGPVDNPRPISHNSMCRSKSIHPRSNLKLHPPVASRNACATPKRDDNRLGSYNLPKPPLTTCLLHQPQRLFVPTSIHPDPCTDQLSGTHQPHQAPHTALDSSSGLHLSCRQAFAMPDCSS
jgi:hypothetical protein